MKYLCVKSNQLEFLYAILDNCDAKDIAERIGVTKQTVYNIIKGRVPLTVSYKYILSAIFIAYINESELKDVLKQDILSECFYEEEL